MRRRKKKARTRGQRMGMGGKEDRGGKRGGGKRMEERRERKGKILSPEAERCSLSIVG